MDILDLSEEIKNLRHNGVTLNLDERMQIEMALNALQASSEADELTFWGKVEGVKADYYIAMALTFRNMYEFPVKTFYWALSGEFIFREMPNLTEQHDDKIDADTSYFQGTPAEKQAWAETQRGDWGFKPRYESKYDFSIKAQKQAQMSPAENIRDMPRLRTRSTKESKDGVMEPKAVRSIVQIASEHNRQPGVFNYDFPQTFYSTFPEIESESYVTLGSSASRRVHGN